MTVTATRRPGSHRSRFSAERRRKLIVGGLSLGLTILLGILFGIPLLWAIGSALKQPNQIHLVPPIWIPIPPQWHNLVDVDQAIPFYLFVKNSFIITISATFGGVLTSSLVAYGFSHFRFRGRTQLFIIVLSTMMLPQEVTLIPTYLLYQKLGWLDTFLPLIVPYYFGGGAFSIFLLRQFFLGIPRDFNDAAKIDGCGHFRYYWQILLPLSIPALITVAILLFQGNWDEFLQPLIYLSTTTKFTVPIGLQALSSALEPEAAAGKPTEQLLMAGSFLSMIPTFVIFFALQRYFIRGVILSGIKG